MENIEKNLRDKFKEHTSTEGIDANELWDSIAPAIAAEDKPSPLTKPFFKDFRNLFLLGLLILISIGAALFYNFNDTSSLDSNLESSNETNFKEAANTDIQSISKNHVQAYESTIEEKTSVENDNSVQSQSLPAVQDNINVEFKSNASIDIENPTKRISFDKNPFTENAKKSNFSTINSTFETAENEDNFQNPINTQLPTLLDENKLSDLEKIVQTIPIDRSNSASLLTDSKTVKTNLANDERGSQHLDLLSVKVAAYPLVSAKNEIPSFIPSQMKIDVSKAKFSVGVFGGTHFVKEKFKGSLAAEISRAEELNKSFKLFPGQNFGAAIYFHLNDHLFASLGLAYSRSISQFNKAIVTLDSAVVRTDFFAGQITRPDFTRTVVHHNKLSSISFPLSLGYQTQFGKWGVGTGAGAAINLSQKFSGKTLSDKGDVVTYPDREKELIPTKRVFVSVHLQPFIQYELSNKLKLQARFDFGISQFGKTKLYDLKHSGITSGFGLGLIYTP